MNKFIEQFKNSANSKSLFSSDMISLCVYKTVKAKSENKEEIFKYFIKKAFTPRKNGSYEGFVNAFRQFKWLTSKKSCRVDNEWVQKRTFMGLEFEEVFDVSEIQVYDDLLESVKNWNPEYE